MGYLFSSSEFCTKKQVKISNESLYVYLEIILTEDNVITTEIKQRIFVTNKTNYGLKKQLNSTNLNSHTGCMQQKPYGSEYSPPSPLSKKDRNMLRIFERRILRMIYFPIKENSKWRTRHISELYRLCDELEVDQMIKIGILKWLIYVFRVQGLVLTESLLFLNQKAPVQKNLS
jgi:hypothetical protein